MNEPSYFATNSKNAEGTLATEHLGGRTVVRYRRNFVPFHFSGTDVIFEYEFTAGTKIHAA
jgi:hypothetical protein